MARSAERLGKSDIPLHPIYMQHVAVYGFAKKFARDKTVLEVGCGEGYGAGLLAEEARRIVGIDYSPDAIEKAKAGQSSGKIEFLCREIDALASERSEGFDLICSFQVIEHIARPEKFLSKIQSLLKPGGIFILSTPNNKMSIVEHPYHYREYDKVTLQALLSKYFSKVDLYGLFFSERVAQFRKKRIRGSHGILRLDPLRLHRLLPRRIRRYIFDVVSWLLSDAIYREDASLVENITQDDYWIDARCVEDGIDLIGVCQR